MGGSGRRRTTTSQHAARSTLSSPALPHTRCERLPQLLSGPGMFQRVSERILSPVQALCRLGTLGGRRAAEPGFVLLSKAVNLARAPPPLAVGRILCIAIGRLRTGQPHGRPRLGRWGASPAVGRTRRVPSCASAAATNLPSCLACAQFRNPHRLSLTQLCLTTLPSGQTDSSQGEQWVAAGAVGTRARSDGAPNGTQHQPPVKRRMAR